MRLLTSFGLFLILVLITHSSSVIADEDITVGQFSSKVSNKKISVDCDVSYDLDGHVQEALRNGIAMTFKLEIELRQQSVYWMDPLVRQFQRIFQVKYHALSKQFVMIEEGNNKERNFPDLYSAFYYQRHIRDIELISVDKLNIEQEYYFRTRARLLSENLPLPLRIKSYVSSGWRPSSGWTKWPM